MKQRKSRVGARRAVEHTIFTWALSGIQRLQQKNSLLGRISRIFVGIGEFFAYTSAQSYGFMSLAFGLLTLLLNLTVSYIGEPMNDILLALIVGAFFSLFSLLLLFSGTPFCLLMQKNRINDYVFFDLLCIRRLPETTRKKGLSAVEAAVIGGALSLLGLFLPLKYVLLTLAAILCLGLSIVSPEFPLMLSTLLLPYLPLLPNPSICLAVIVLTAFLAFLRKCFFGKRVFYLENYDFLLFGMMAVITVSSAFSDSVSLKTALMLCAMSLAYPLANNLFATPRLVESAEQALLASSIPAGLFAIVQAFGVFGGSDPAYLDKAFIGVIRTRVSAFFGNPNVYAVYLLVILLLSLALFLRRGKKLHGFYFAVMCLSMIDLLLTFCRGAWIAAIIGAGALLFMRWRHSPTAVLCVPIALPLVFFFLPESVSARLLSVVNLQDSSILTRFAIWRSSLRLFLDRIFLGIGAGEAAFREAYAPYAEAGAGNAAHPHNIFLSIGIAGGVFALIFFVSILAVRLRRITVYRTILRTTSMHEAAIAACAVTFSLLLFGMTDDIFFVFSMVYLFWLIFGIGSASLRICHREYNERQAYYGADNAGDAAGVDVQLR